MAYQKLFERVEKKYLLSPGQYAALLPRLGEWFVPDQYGRSTVMSLYYDTPDCRLIRRSLEKPVYKEKLRVRSYGVPGEEDPVFLELKKKLDGVVYKRRLALPCREAALCLKDPDRLPRTGQTGQELGVFVRRYRDLAPRAMILCERAALRGRREADLRATLDSGLRWRDRGLDLTAGAWGAPLLREGEVLLELKAAGALPLDLVRLLAELRVYPRGFSKYGLCYREHLMEPVCRKGGNCCA